MLLLCPFHPELIIPLGFSDSLEARRWARSDSYCEEVSGGASVAAERSEAREEQS